MCPASDDAGHHPVSRPERAAKKSACGDPAANAATRPRNLKERFPRRSAPTNLPFGWVSVGVQDLRSVPRPSLCWNTYIAQFADVRDEKGHRLVVRNGCHESRTVTTSAGAVDVHGTAGQRQACRPGYR